MTIEHAPIAPDFEGTPVYAVTAVIKGLGDGLSKAVKTDQRIVHPGDRVVFIIEAECKAIEHVELKDSDGLGRKQVFVGDTVTFGDEKIVRASLDEQKRKNDALKGIQQLPPGDSDVYGDGTDEDPEAAPALSAVPDQ